MKPDDLARSARERNQRVQRAQREGQRAWARNLALAGSIAWLIVLPMLLMLVLGFWLDRKTHSQVLWTGTLLCVGAGIGSWLAWQRIHDA